MTNLQEDLTLALQRRAEVVTVENNLDAILDGHNIIRFSNDNGPNPRPNRMLVAAVSVAIVVGAGGLIWANNIRTEPPAASSATPVSVDASPGEAPTVSPPRVTSVTIPTEFPSDVPRPDTFELMTFITSDTVPVGWQFYDQREPTDSVERCTQYASSFDASWTAAADTNEAPSTLYAQIFDNARWQVGIYCLDNGGYLVQVVPLNGMMQLTAENVTSTSPPTPTAAPLEAVVVAILYSPNQPLPAEELANALRDRGVNVEAVTEATRVIEQTMLMPVGRESTPASNALAELIHIGGFDTWTPNFASSLIPENVTDVIILGQDGGPALPLPQTRS